MGQISQRELRNDNADVVRRVESGEELTVTRRGVPVARLIPIGRESLACERPARTDVKFSNISRVKVTETTTAILDELRGER